MRWHGRWRQWERRLRSALAWISFFAIIAFFAPVSVILQAFIQGRSGLDAHEAHVVV